MINLIIIAVCLSLSAITVRLKNGYIAGPVTMLLYIVMHINVVMITIKMVS